jgi:hypothetical protein
MKKDSRVTGLVVSLLGVFVLLNSLDNPRIEALHGAEILRLIASGMGFGIGFVGLMGRLNVSKE